MSQFSVYLNLNPNLKLDLNPDLNPDLNRNLKLANARAAQGRTI